MSDEFINYNHYYYYHLKSKNSFIFLDNYHFLRNFIQMITLKFYFLKFNFFFKSIKFY